MAERKRLITTGSRLRLRLASDERLVGAIRRGDSAAFDALYRRHAGELLSFGAYMLASRQDAEDALQATFASAYRALRADKRPVALRPWLFAIMRNECLSILRRSRPTVELNGEPALRGDPLTEVELREEVRHLLEDLRGLPECQKAALVLAELHGLNQSEIAIVLGVRAEQVKAYVYQARSNLISERRARDADCREIREQLASARGAMLLRGRFRRHLRSCTGCRSYADRLARQHRALGAVLPLVPTLALRYRTLEDALGIGGADPATYAAGAAVGGTMAGAAAGIAGGGVKALAGKAAAGAVALGLGATVGVSVLGSSPYEGTAPASATVTPALVAAARPPRATAAGEESAVGRGTRRERARAKFGAAPSLKAAATSPPNSNAAPAESGEGSVLSGPGAEEGGEQGARQLVAPGEREQPASATSSAGPQGSQQAHAGRPRAAEQHAHAGERQLRREQRERARERRAREAEEPPPEIGGDERTHEDKEEHEQTHQERVREREERKQAREQRMREHEQRRGEG